MDITDIDPTITQFRLKNVIDGRIETLKNIAIDELVDIILCAASLLESLGEVVPDAKDFIKGFLTYSANELMKED